MALFKLPVNQPCFSSLNSRVTQNDRPPVFFKAGGFFCSELDADKKLPPVLQALSDYWIQQMNQGHKREPLIIATDGTVTSQKQFEKIRDHFLAKGIDVYSPFSKIDKEFPMTLGILSYYTKNFAELNQPSKQCAGGLLITVGQNPWGTVGLRVIKPNGAMADPEMIKTLNELTERPKYLKANDYKRGKHYPYHFNGKYYDSLSKIIDLKVIGRYYQHIFHNALSGATGVFWGDIIYPAIKQICSIRDGFYDKTDYKKIKIGPFIEESNINDLKKIMEMNISAEKIGFINDSEGLGTAVISDEHNAFNASDCFLLLLNHFVVNKQRVGKIIKTHDTSNSIDELALKFGLPVIELPSNFYQITSLVDNSKQSILIAGDGAGKLIGLNHSLVPDSLFTNVAILEASGLSKQNIETQLRQIKNKLLYVYTTTQYAIKGDLDAQRGILKTIGDLALYGGRVGAQKINLKRTLQHNREMKKYFNYQDEYKLFFDNGSWIVARLLNGQIRLTIETQVLKRKLGWFNRNLALDEHEEFIKSVREKISSEAMRVINFYKINY